MFQICYFSKLSALEVNLSTYYNKLVAVIN